MLTAEERAELFGDGQAQAVAVHLLVNSHPALRQLRQLRRRHPGAVVFDGDDYLGIATVDRISREIVQ